MCRGHIAGAIQVISWLPYCSCVFTASSPLTRHIPSLNTRVSICDYVQSVINVLVPFTSSSRSIRPCHAHLPAYRDRHAMKMRGRGRGTSRPLWHRTRPDHHYCYIQCIEILSSNNLEIMNHIKSNYTKYFSTVLAPELAT